MTSEKIANEKTFYPQWFKFMKLKETHEHYNIYNYINLDIYTTPDNKFFNVSRLTRLLTVKTRADGTESTSKSWTRIMRSKKWTSLRRKHPEFFKEVRGDRTQLYKGWYLQWVLFSTFVGDVCGSDFNFELGEPITEDHSGYIYMCTPESCDGSNTVKFGRTWNWDQRVVAYGKGTWLEHLIPVDDMYLAEEKMLKYMDSFLTKSNKGDEYYDINTGEEEEKVFGYFMNLCEELNVKDLA